MQQQSLEEVRKDVIQLLARAVVDRKHPFRTMVVGTVGNGLANMRNVVLRKLDKDPLRVVFYTDRRSTKVLDLQVNPSISFLFWHPKQRIQLRAVGVASIENQTKQTAQIWNSLNSESKASYLTKLPPGARVEKPTSGLPNNFPEDQKKHSEDHFTIVTSKIEKLEFLKLDRLAYRRAEFEKVANNWEGSWLVP